MWFGDPKFCMVSSKSPNYIIGKFDGAAVTRSAPGLELLDTPSYKTFSGKNDRIWD